MSTSFRRMKAGVVLTIVAGVSCKSMELSTLQDSNQVSGDSLGHIHPEDRRRMLQAPSAEDTKILEELQSLEASFRRQMTQTRQKLLELTSSPVSYWDILTFKSVGPFPREKAEWIDKSIDSLIRMRHQIIEKKRSLLRYDENNAEHQKILQNYMFPYDLRLQMVLRMFNNDLDTSISGQIWYDAKRRITSLSGDAALVHQFKKFLEKTKDDAEDYIRLTLQTAFPPRQDIYDSNRVKILRLVTSQLLQGVNPEQAGQIILANAKRDFYLSPFEGLLLESDSARKGALEHRRWLENQFQALTGITFEQYLQTKKSTNSPPRFDSSSFNLLNAEDINDYSDYYRDSSHTDPSHDELGRLLKRAPIAYGTDYHILMGINIVESGFSSHGKIALATPAGGGSAALTMLMPDLRLNSPPYAWVYSLRYAVGMSGGVVIPNVGYWISFGLNDSWTTSMFSIISNFGLGVSAESHLGLVIGGGGAQIIAAPKRVVVSFYAGIGVTAGAHVGGGVDLFYESPNSEMIQSR